MPTSPAAGSCANVLYDPAAVAGISAATVPALEAAGAQAREVPTRLREAHWLLEHEYMF